MSKIVNPIQWQKPTSDKVYVHTLAQLSTGTYKKLDSKQLGEQLNLQKRAKAKAFTNSYLFDLIDLNSNLQKSYWSTYHCTKVILQDDNEFTAKYCNQRWCLTCNRIRTAKMINGYKAPLEELEQTYLVTLSLPNVKAKYLKQSIEVMTDSLKDIRKNMKKTYGLTLKGLRKYECTYNEKRNDYHPHFHLIVEGKTESDKLVDLWLKKNPTADMKGQDITQTKEGSLNELCKYFTKVISKDNDYNPKALDIMFRASKGKRTFQPIGIKKEVNENIEEIQAQTVTFKPPRKEIWAWEGEGIYDWTTADGETLSEYSPTKQDLEVINQDYKPKR